MIVLLTAILVLLFSPVILFRRRTRSAHKKQYSDRPVAIGFPLLCTLLGFEVRHDVPRGAIEPIHAHYINVMLIFTAPIQLKEYDLVWVDHQSGKVEMIERAGIVIWRAAWVN